MKNIFSVIVFLFFISVSASDLFVLPKDAKVINRDKTGKTWRVNAVLNLPLDKAKKLLHAAVLKSNYKLKHEIPMDEKGKEHFILSYLKGKETLILMIWSPDGKKTFFAYGVTKQ